MPRLSSTTGVRSVDIVDAEIVNADVSASAAIAHSKLANLTGGQVLLGNGSNVPTGTALSGDVTVSSTGVATIGAGVVSAAKVAADVATQAELDAHDVDTTSVHGIANTANLVLKGATTYAASNVTTDRTYDANATSLDEIADVLGTLIADLRTLGAVL